MERLSELGYECKVNVGFDALLLLWNEKKENTQLCFRWLELVIMSQNVLSFLSLMGFNILEFCLKVFMIDRKLIW